MEGINFDSASDKLFESLNNLMNEEDIELKTRLSKHQIRALCFHHFHLQIMSGESAYEAQMNTILYFKKLLVSHNSRSREELLRGFEGAKIEARYQPPEQQ